mmetsp:Transcript_19505/g.65896  ORF Transcript_19505/g.65896 Transcript_19505/m.65896 type:complete len:239 (+) Transcript_19505:1846-2562(+)
MLENRRSRRLFGGAGVDEEDGVVKAAADLDHCAGQGEVRRRESVLVVAQAELAVAVPAENEAPPGRRHHRGVVAPARGGGDLVRRVPRIQKARSENATFRRSVHRLLKAQLAGIVPPKPDDAPVSPDRDGVVVAARHRFVRGLVDARKNAHDADLAALARLPVVVPPARHQSAVGDGARVVLAAGDGRNMLQAQRFQRRGRRPFGEIADAELAHVVPPKPKDGALAGDERVVVRRRHV